MPDSLLSNDLATLISLALKEDIGSGDLTSEATIEQNLTGQGAVIAREPLRVCGMEIVKVVCAMVDPQLKVKVLKEDGADVVAETQLAVVSGSVRSLLTAERTLLNFLQRLSGIATQTARLVRSVEGTGVQLLDTRKTTPGYRTLEKYAVKIGGGKNHRIGLFDLFLVKNNHIDALGGDVRQAIARCRALQQERWPAAPANGTRPRIEVEVRNEAELRAALAERPDIILLDNMSPLELRQAVQLRAQVKLQDAVLFEASGGINERNLPDYAATGVEYLSLGALTHSVRAVDISFRIAF